MILKIGYFNGKQNAGWKYFNNIKNLIITPFNEHQYFYTSTDDCILSFDVNGDQMNLNCDMFELQFNKRNMNGSQYATEVRFWDCDTLSERRLLCVSETVYLMNDSGKTIDKY